MHSSHSLAVNLSRRNFLGGTLAATAAGTLFQGLVGHAEENLASTNAPPRAEYKRKIKLGLIGCGGRGSWLGGEVAAYVMLNVQR